MRRPTLAGLHSLSLHERRMRDASQVAINRCDSHGSLIDPKIRWADLAFVWAKIAYCDGTLHALSYAERHLWTVDTTP